MIAAIAVLENVNPMDLEVVLHDYIDPTALDALVSNEKPVALSFPFGDYRIRIDGNVLAVRGG